MSKTYNNMIYAGGIAGFVYGNYMAYKIYVEVKKYSFMNHYMSPVVVMTGIGFASGALFPVLLPLYITGNLPRHMSVVTSNDERTNEKINKALDLPSSY